MNGQKRKTPHWLKYFSNRKCLVLLAMMVLLTGCTAFGPRHIPHDQFSYNRALAKSTKHQMLLNLLRMRYLEEPVFLSVSSILAQYVYNAGAGVEATIGFNGGTDQGVFDANLRYEERPTITYIPIEEQEFSLHMLKPIPSETIFAAAKQGGPLISYYASESAA